MSATISTQRMRYRSWHRGTREMDLLMGSFADAYLLTFTAAQLKQFERILELNDPDLYGWLTQSDPIPVEHDSEVMQMFCRHSFAKS